MPWRLGVRSGWREHSVRDRCCPSQVPPGPAQLHGVPPMTWQTPTATDFRFGFEITMYVAAR
jgi:coenzyme PQQ precursor peptide PqqA